MLNFCIWIFGFISGFILLITGNTLNFWVSSEGASPDIVGIFSLITLPYALNFLWAPLIDKYELKFFHISTNYKIQWLVLLHVIGALIVSILSKYNPAVHHFKAAFIALLLSFINCTQDLVLNSFRTEILNIKEQQKTSGIYIFGYRCGMLLSGSGAIYLSDFLSMQFIYQLFAVFYLAFALSFIWFSKFLSTKNKNKTFFQESNNSTEKLLDIFKYFGPFKNILLFLLFLILYRVADNFISVMLNPFLLDMGYNAKEIAVAGRLCGIIGSAIGGLMASFFIPQIGLINSLVYFAIIHSAAHLGYIAVFYMQNVFSLVTATIFESFTGGMTMSAYIGLISNMCCGKFRATQYAIFSAMMGASRALLPTFSGIVVLNTNWIFFFIFSVTLVLPSLLILKKLEPIIIKRLNAGYNNN